MNDPLSGYDPSWINMQTQVAVSSGTFTVNGLLHTGVPADGAYRFGVFNEASFSPNSTSSNSQYAIKIRSTWCADLNRNGVCHYRNGSALMPIQAAADLEIS